LSQARDLGREFAQSRFLSFPASRRRALERVVERLELSSLPFAERRDVRGELRDVRAQQLDRIGSARGRRLVLRDRDVHALADDRERCEGAADQNEDRDHSDTLEQFACHAVDSVEQAPVQILRAMDAREDLARPERAL
jgi:hypothetical protein